MTSKKVRTGSRVELLYEFRLGDGTVVEGDLDGEVIDFIIGEGELPEKIENSLLDKYADDGGAIQIKAEEMVFGDYDADLIQVIELDDFSDYLSPQPGNLIDFDLPDGRSVAGRVVRVFSDQVEVDFNHPFCGHDVEFVYHLAHVK